MTDGDVLNLRKGESLILHCKGDAKLYSFLVMKCHGVYHLIKFNKSDELLRYTWYCEATSDTAIVISGLNITTENTDVLMELTIRVHDLESYLPAARATPSPCASSEHTAPTDPIEVRAGKNQGINQSLTDGPTVTTDTRTEPQTVSTTTIERYLFCAVVGVLLVLVVALLVTVVVVVKCSRRRREPTTEEGAKSTERASGTEQQANFNETIGGGDNINSTQ